MSDSLRSRRRFLLQTAAATAGVVALLSGSGALVEAGARSRRLTDLDREDLRRLRGHRFRILDEEGRPVPARLVAVDDRSHLTRRERIEQLSLVFRTGEKVPHSQAVFQVERSGLAPTPLLLVPVRHGRRGTHYEAVFTRPA